MSLLPARPFDIFPEKRFQTREERAARFRALRNRKRKGSHRK